MCAHYNFSKGKDIEQYYDMRANFDLKESYDVYPGYEAPVVTENGIELMKWGFIAPWVQGKNKHKLFNAKSETLDEKASFREVLAQRCLIPLTSFFEYKTEDDGKKKRVEITLPDRKIFSVAGLYKYFKGENGDEIPTYTMITTPAGNYMKAIHNRGIAILDRDEEKEYLNSDMTEYSEISSFFKPYDSEMRIQ